MDQMYNERWEVGGITHTQYRQWMGELQWKVRKIRESATILEAEYEKTCRWHN